MSVTSVRPDSERRHSALRRAFIQFTARSVVALCLLSLGTLLISELIARHESLRVARAMGTAVAHGVAGPLVDAAVRRGEPGPVERLATVLENRMRDDSVSHIKVWDDAGRVIWSDESGLIGERFELTDAVSRLFGTRNAISEISEPDREENREEVGEGAYVEVYVGTHDADGRPLVVESYVSPEFVDNGTVVILRSVLPFGIGGLVLMVLTLLPLAMSLARAVQKSEIEQQRLARQAVAAAEVERRRIAQELHDGVVQDLAGLGYTLPGLGGSVAPGPAGDSARAAIEAMTESAHRAVRDLRTLLVDLYPPELADGGLEQALRGLAVGLEEACGTKVDVTVGPSLDLSAAAAETVYRVAREGLRNVVQHAAARHADLVVVQQGDRTTVVITDDGRGLLGGADEGHLGLRLLTDSLSTLGGRLTVTERKAGGVVLTAVIPNEATVGSMGTA